MILKVTDIYVNSNLDPFTTFSCCRSIEFKKILPPKIPQIISTTTPILTRIVINCTMRRYIPFGVWRKGNENCDSNIRISQSRESYHGTNTRVRRNKEIQNFKTVSLKVTDPSRDVNNLSKLLSDKKIIRVHQVYQFYHNRLTSLYDRC